MTPLKPEREENESVKKASSLCQQGDDAFCQGDWDVATTAYEEALPIFTSFGLTKQVAYCHQSLGNIGLRVSRLPWAETHFSLAAPLFNGLGDIRGYADCMKRLGNVAFCKGDLDCAIRYFEQTQPIYASLKVGGDLGAVEREAACWRSLGDVAILRQDADGAEKYFAHAKPLFEEAKSEVGVGSCISGEGETELIRGNVRVAIDKFRLALEIYERHAEDAKWAMAFVTRQLGLAALREELEESETEKLSASKAYLATAVEHAQECGNALELAHCLRDLDAVKSRMLLLVDAASALSSN